MRRRLLGSAGGGGSVWRAGEGGAAEQRMDGGYEWWSSGQQVQRSRQDDGDGSACGMWHRMASHCHCITIRKMDIMSWRDWRLYDSNQALP